MSYIVIVVLAIALAVIYSIFDAEDKTSWPYLFYRIFLVISVMIVALKLEGILFYLGLIIVPLVFVSINHLVFAISKPTFKSDVLVYLITVGIILAFRFF